MLDDAERGALQEVPYEILVPIRRRVFAFVRKPETPGLPPTVGGGASMIVIAL